MKGDKRKIKAINDGTIYDVAANLTKVSRSIRDGKFSKVVDAVVIVRYFDSENKQRIFTRSFGTGDPAENLLMLEIAKKDITG